MIHVNVLSRHNSRRASSFYSVVPERLETQHRARFVRREVCRSPSRVRRTRYLPFVRWLPSVLSEETSDRGTSSSSRPREPETFSRALRTTSVHCGSDRTLRRRYQSSSEVTKAAGSAMSGETNATARAKIRGAMNMYQATADESVLGGACHDRRWARPSRMPGRPLQAKSSASKKCVS